VIILLKSATGKIPAGSVALDLTKTTIGSIKNTVKIDKCPDKNATIEFSIEVQSLG
jgi:hypothetical protein